MYHTMIVDDEPLMRTYLTQSIPAFSTLFDVSAAAKDGLEAVELLKEIPVDVVITDIKMPEMDGLSLAKHIHENYPGITVIIISGFSDFEYAQKAIRYNVKDYLLKPLVDKTLIDLLDTLAARFERERGTARFRMTGTGAKRDPLRHRLLCAFLEEDTERAYHLYRELRKEGHSFMGPFACIAKFQCLYHRFTSMEQLRADGLTVEAANYSQVYRGLLTENDTLDSIFERFNVDRPEDFHGHSLSVSDVVLLHKGGEGKAYYVDSFGFSELPRFVEQLRENPLETAEKSTEQNYNMIDGQINNLPPELSSEPKQAAYLLGNSAYLTIQTTESGQDYTLYRKNLSEVETGRLEEPGLTMEAARHELMKKFQIEEYKVEPVDWDTLKKQIATTALTGLPPILHDVLTQEGPWLLNPEKEPVVHILWSEHPELSDDLTLPLHVADRLFKQLDEKQRIDRENPDHHGGWYEKTKFEIKCTFQGQPDSYEGRQDFGDGDGSLIDHIRGIAEYYQNDEQLKNRILHELGPDGLQEETASYDMLLNEFVPYLQLHCNLAEMEATAHSGRQTLQAAGELDETGKNTLDYYRAVGSYVEAGQLALNSGNYDLPDAPSLEVFLTPGMDAYKEQVKEEIRQEAASYGMTVEQYAANGWEPVSSYQPVEATSPEQPVTEQKTAPSLDAIEARVQAGEAISVLAIAEAVKAEKSKKPSVHDKLETAKKQTPAKTRTPRTKKPKELERS